MKCLKISFKFIYLFFVTSSLSSLALEDMPQAAFFTKEQADLIKESMTKMKQSSLESFVKLLSKLQQTTQSNEKINNQLKETQTELAKVKKSLVDQAVANKSLEKDKIDFDNQVSAQKKMFDQVINQLGLGLADVSKIISDFPIDLGDFQNSTDQFDSIITTLLGWLEIQQKLIDDFAGLLDLSAGLSQEPIVIDELPGFPDINLSELDEILQSGKIFESKMKTLENNQAAYLSALFGELNLISSNFIDLQSLLKSLLDLQLDAEEQALFPEIDWSIVDDLASLADRFLPLIDFLAENQKKLELCSINLQKILDADFKNLEEVEALPDFGFFDQALDLAKSLEEAFLGRIEELKKQLKKAQMSEKESLAKDSRIRDLESKIAETESLLEKEKQNKDKVNASLADLQKSFSSLVAQKEAQDKKVGELGSQVDALQKLKQDLEEKIRKLEEQLKTLISANDVAKQEKSRLEELNAGYQKQIEQLQQYNQSLQMALQILQNNKPATTSYGYSSAPSFEMAQILSKLNSMELEQKRLDEAQRQKELDLIREKQLAQELELKFGSLQKNSLSAPMSISQVTNVNTKEAVDRKKKKKVSEEKSENKNDSASKKDVAVKEPDKKDSSNSNQMNPSAIEAEEDDGFWQAYLKRVNNLVGQLEGVQSKIDVTEQRIKDAELMIKSLNN